MKLYDVELIEVVAKEDLIFSPDEFKELAKISEKVNFNRKKQECYFAEELEIGSYEYDFDINQHYDNFAYEMNLIIRFCSMQFGPTWFRDIPDSSLINEILSCYRETEEFNKDINNAKHLYSNSRLLIGTALVYFRRKLSNEVLSEELRDKYSKYVIALDNYIDVAKLI